MDDYSSDCYWGWYTTATWDSTHCTLTPPLQPSPPLNQRPSSPQHRNLLLSTDPAGGEGQAGMVRWSPWLPYSFFFFQLSPLHRRSLTSSRTRTRIPWTPQTGPCLFHLKTRRIENPHPVGVCSSFVSVQRALQHTSRGFLMTCNKSFFDPWRGPHTHTSIPLTLTHHRGCRHC